MIRWEYAAQTIQEVYGGYVEKGEDNFFVCPYCDEPIYKEDWLDHDFLICPVCEENLFDEVEEEW